MMVSNARKKQADELIIEYLNISGHCLVNDISLDNNYDSLMVESLSSLNIDDSVILALLDYISTTYDIQLSDVDDVLKASTLNRISTLITKYI